VTLSAGVPDFGCDVYNNKHKHCTESSVPTFIMMLAIITVMARLVLGKDDDLGYYFGYFYG